MADQERTESEGFYEMLWDCDHCETKGLLGKSQRFCATCGSPQNPDKRYFPTPEQQKKVDGHQFEGADRTCPNCSAAMGAKATNCTNCGAPLDGSAPVKGVAPQVPVAPVKKPRRWWLVALVLVLIFGGAFGIWFRCIRTRTETLALVAHKWDRTIAIEQYGDHDNTAWRNEVPTDATGMTCSKKQRTTKQVADGEDCHTEKHDKKDGTFEQVKKCKPKYKSEGVDDDWCNYRVRRWQKIDEVKASGTGMTPAWPAIPNVPATDNSFTMGAKRQGAKTENLILDFGDDRTCTVKDSQWQKHKDGEKLKLEVRASSGDLICDDL
jgi:hypothetical protein